MVKAAEDVSMAAGTNWGRGVKGTGLQNQDEKRERGGPPRKNEKGQGCPSQTGT